MAGSNQDIKSMGLYRNVRRILVDLEHAGLGGDAPLSVDDLVPHLGGVGVELVGAVERDRGDPVAHLEQDIRVHGYSV